MATQSPAYPLPGEEVRVLVNEEIDTDSEIAVALDIERPELTIVSVPPDSELETGDVVDSEGNPTDRFTPDVAGDYAVTVQSYREYLSAPADGGRYSGYRKVLLSSSALTVRVGEEMVLPVAITGEHAMTLRLGVFNGTVRTATLTDTTSDKAYAASIDATVVTKLEALIGVAASSVGPDLDDAVGNLIDVFEAHRIKGGTHFNNDTTNVYEPTRPHSNADSIRQLNAFRDLFVRHLLNGSVSDLPWHGQDDTKNVPIVGTATGLPTAMVLYADICRCWEAHRVQILAPEAHDNADGTSVLGTLDKLTDLLATLIAYIANSSPTIPTGVEDGIVQLQSLYGFRRAS